MSCPLSPTQQQQQLQPPAATYLTRETRRHFDSIKDIELRLQDLSAEKDQLDTEYRRMPITGGTLAQKRRKNQVESRIDELEREIRSLKLTLKSMHAL